MFWNVQHLILEFGADSAMPVKDNWPTRPEDIRLLTWYPAAEFTASEKGHGRIEAQRWMDGAPHELAAVPGAEPSLPHRARVARCPHRENLRPDRIRSWRVERG